MEAPCPRLTPGPAWPFPARVVIVRAAEIVVAPPPGMYTTVFAAGLPPATDPAGSPLATGSLAERNQLFGVVRQLFPELPVDLAEPLDEETGPDGDGAAEQRPSCPDERFGR